MRPVVHAAGCRPEAVRPLRCADILGRYPTMPAAGDRWRCAACRDAAAPPARARASNSLPRPARRSARCRRWLVDMLRPAQRYRARCSGAVGRTSTRTRRCAPTDVPRPAQKMSGKASRRGRPHIDVDATPRADAEAAGGQRPPPHVGHVNRASILFPAYAETSASLSSRQGIGGVRTAAQVRRGSMAARS